MTERYYLQGKDYALPDFSATFMFDANIWLSVNGPFQDPNGERAKAYSGFYRKILENNSRVLFPQIVMSEFLNRSVLMNAEANNYNRATDGKIHKQAGYSDWIKDACDFAHHICSDHERIPDRFDKIAIEDRFNDAEGAGMEFNDLLIADLCLEHRCLFVTDDADFSGVNVPVVTWNLRLR